MRFEPITIPWTGPRTQGIVQPVPPWYRAAPVTLAFVATCVLGFIVILLAGEDLGQAIVSALELVPGVFIAEPWRMLTYGFVFTSLVDLWPSCIFVLLMGAALEAEIGSVAMLQVMGFSTISGALAYSFFNSDEFYGASLTLGGIFAALVALPRHRGGRRLIAPRTGWPLLGFVFAHKFIAEHGYPGFEAFLGCFAVGLIFGATHRPERPPDVRRAIARARQSIAWLAIRLGDHRLPG